MLNVPPQRRNGSAKYSVGGVIEATNDHPDGASPVELILVIAADADALWRQRVLDALRVEIPETIEILAPAESELTALPELQAGATRSFMLVFVVSPALIDQAEFLTDPLWDQAVRQGQPARVHWVHAVEAPWRNTRFVEVQALLSPERPLSAMSSDWPTALAELALQVAEVTAVVAMAGPPSVAVDPIPGIEAASPPLIAADDEAKSAVDDRFAGSFFSPPFQSILNADSPLRRVSPPSSRGSPRAGSPRLSTLAPRAIGGDAGSRVAGFRPDAVQGKDQLDVRREALTLAMVLAHKDVDPPISVGLFGDWGSGKSFFMAEMRKIIDHLSERSRVAGGRFCEHVVQLEFNAWHYMDSDLWASLAREIFEGLASAVADREGPNLDLERERLRAATRSTKDLITATDAQVVQVRRQLAETQQTLEGVERARSSVSDVAHATMLAVLKTPEVEHKLRGLASDLHLTEAGQSLEELKSRFDGLTGTARWGRAIGVALAQRWSGLLVGLAISAAAALLAYKVALSFGQTIARLMTWLASAAGAITVLVATVGRAAAATIARVDTFRQALEKNLREQRVQREIEIRARQTKLDAEHRALDEQRTRYEQELERLTKLSLDLGKLAASRQLVDFIRQRDASSDYRAQLGTVARASQDFKRLSDLMSRAAAARKKQAEGSAAQGDDEDARLPRVDRIVLYIDDLDRCPEKKVVDVLQAVHLLLAYPLFVVVVGVDPRWLLHSLEEHSGVLRMHADRDGREQGYEWQSTSLNYLEKIFQIPYTLRPMSSDGFIRLVNDLSGAKAERSTAEGLSVRSTKSSPRASVSPSPSPPAAGSPYSSPSMPSGIVTSPTSSPGISRARSESLGAAVDEFFDVNPAALELDERERLFMPRLYNLIPTPRAVKRFVNVYRLVRASIADEHELNWFLDGGEFMAVQIMLALVTGVPAEAAEILRELLSKPEQGAWNLDWWDLVDGVIKPRIDQANWRRLNERLAAIRASTGIPRTGEAYRKWADDVARYSFYSGRVLLGPRDAGSRDETS
jgi:hypothetical protein